MKLSEKGSEQRSEHGFGLYSGATTGRKMPFGCLMRPRPGHLRDFSDSFKAKFAEHLFHARPTTLWSAPRKRSGVILAPLRADQRDWRDAPPPAPRSTGSSRRETRWPLALFASCVIGHCLLP